MVGLIHTNNNNDSVEMKCTREEPTITMAADAHKWVRPSSGEEEEHAHGLGSIITTCRIERTYGGCAMDEAKEEVMAQTKTRLAAIMASSNRVGKIA